MDVCPGNAITESRNGALPQHSRDMCLGCGQCLSACPLEAFTSPNFTESFMLNRLAGERSLHLHCYRAADSLEDSVLGSETYDLNVCFAALSPGCLFELASTRECVLDTNHCAGCPLFISGHETLALNFGIALELMRSWDVDGSLTDTAGVLRAKVSRPTHASESPGAKGSPATRKSLSSLSARYSGIQAIKADLTCPTLFRTTGRHAPSWRIRLAREWKRLEALGQSPHELLLPEVEIDQDLCRACGTCMQFCLTGAIKHTIDDGVFTYSHLPGLCVDCGLCRSACPNSALRREYRAEDKPFERRNVLSKAVKYCTRCKSPFVSEEVADLCLWCCAEPDVHELVEYSRTKMHFDDVVAREDRQ